MSEPFAPGADLVAQLNAHRGGFEIALGLVFTESRPTRSSAKFRSVRT